jgi:hypothetical protein
MCCREHAEADPNYINIGDSNLIQNRSDYPVGIAPPGGTLGEYVPFYFGPHSPMLLRIRDGKGVIKRPQSDIVYICCNLSTIITKCKKWCFTDGHAKKKITNFFNKEEDLNKVDWNMVKEKRWSNTDEDEDRMRRKQAEFLVNNYVPTDCIGGIVVYDEKAKVVIETILAKLKLNLQVRISPQHYY